MALESGEYITDLVITNPVGGDLKSTLDDHARLTKKVLKQSFPAISGAVTATHTQLNTVPDLAPKASPTFTGTPAAPTAALGTSTTQLATTAFVAATSFSTNLPGQTSNSGKFLTTDGTNASWANVPISGSLYTESGTWVCPAGVVKARVTVVGGGASSQTAAAQNCAGGAGGGACISWFTALTPGASYTVTVGAGGAAVTWSGSPVAGNSGGTSSFSGTGITTMTATGGVGGSGGYQSSNGGVGSGGTLLNLVGGSATASANSIGMSGASIFAPPALVAAPGYGGGGYGASAAASSVAGSSGVVIIEYEG